MKRLKIIQVTSNVFCVQRCDVLSCSYFVQTDNGIVLIDSGVDVEGEDMRQSLHTVDSTFSDVVSILITH